ncbi:MAG TPA: cysteine synthase family protein [Chloroflexia bacterium]|jgi:cysteine synthase B|nr:cysteine synthase family protein [Chloroflexia bacterium]
MLSYRSTQNQLSPVLPPPARDGAETIVDRIGNTPLLRLARLPAAAGVAPGVEILAKAEWFNPGGSVKDRAAWSMIRDGERRGLLTPDKTILDATSGNTGIAYAMIGAALGYRVKLCLPRNASTERKRILLAYGAELILTDPRLGTDGAQQEARRLQAAEPDRYFYPDQYNNPANWQAHYEGTGREIWEQTGGRLTHFVAVLGTSGTFMGTARRLKEQNPQIRVYAVQPDSPLHGLEGMKHMPTALVPGIYDPALADEHLTVDTEAAQAVTRDLARYEGLFAGPSGGAAVLACLQVARTLDQGTIVTVLPDGGSRYLSDSFWDEGTP